MERLINFEKESVEHYLQNSGGLIISICINNFCLISQTIVVPLNKFCRECGMLYYIWSAVCTSSYFPAQRGGCKSEHYSLHTRMMAHCEFCDSCLRSSSGWASSHQRTTQNRRRENVVWRRYRRASARRRPLGWGGGHLGSAFIVQYCQG